MSKNEYKTTRPSNFAGETMNASHYAGLVLETWVQKKRLFAKLFRILSILSQSRNNMLAISLSKSQWNTSLFLYYVEYLIDMVLSIGVCFVHKLFF